MDLREVKRQIKELIDLMQGTQVSELEVERGGVRIKIRKDQITPEGGHFIPQIPLPQDAQMKSTSLEGGPKTEQDDYNYIRSPIVGTFYRAPSPEAEPYVEVGEVVKKGQILCVVEAMKLMNEIESEVDGKIVEILVENARPVEYGESLFKIEPLKEPKPGQ
jgi:acetyl-CoA carboxylase biotin carboxyl carrier protein